MHTYTLTGLSQCLCKTRPWYIMRLGTERLTIILFTNVCVTGDIWKGYTYCQLIPRNRSVQWPGETGRIVT